LPTVRAALSPASSSTEGDGGHGPPLPDPELPSTALAAIGYAGLRRRLKTRRRRCPALGRPAASATRWSHMWTAPKGGPFSIQPCGRASPLPASLPPPRPARPRLKPGRKPTRHQSSVMQVLRSRTGERPSLSSAFALLGASGFGARLAADFPGPGLFPCWALLWEARRGWIRFRVPRGEASA